MTSKAALQALLDAVDAKPDIFPSDFPAGFIGRDWAIRAFYGSMDAALAFNEIAGGGEDFNMQFRRYDGLYDFKLYGSNGYISTVSPHSFARAFLMADLRAMMEGAE